MSKNFIISTLSAPRGPPAKYLTHIPREELIMNRTELVDAIAVKADISKKDADAAVKAFIEVVSDELQNKGKVQLVGFGTFETSERAARTGRNPQTGAATKIKACTAPKFKAGKALKDKVNTKPSKKSKK